MPKLIRPGLLCLLALVLLSCGIGGSDVSSGASGSSLVDPIFTQPQPSLPSGLYIIQTIFDPPLGTVRDGVGNPIATYLDGITILGISDSHCNLETQEGRRLRVPTVTTGFGKLYYVTQDALNSGLNLATLLIDCPGFQTEPFVPENGIYAMDPSGGYAVLQSNRLLVPDNDTIGMMELADFNCFLEVEFTYTDVLGRSVTSSNRIPPFDIKQYGAFVLLENAQSGVVTGFTDSVARLVCQSLTNRQVSARNIQLSL